LPRIGARSQNAGTDPANGRQRLLESRRALGLSGSRAAYNLRQRRPKPLATRSRLSNRSPCKNRGMLIHAIVNRYLPTETY
jgi:hypothetical protein